MTLLCTVVIMSITYAQNYDYKNLQINPFVLNKIHEIQNSVEFDIPKPPNESLTKGTGINNAVEFNNWGEMFPVFFPYLVPSGWMMLTANTAAHRHDQAYIGEYAMYIETGFIAELEEFMGGVALVGMLQFVMGWPPFTQIVGEDYSERPSMMNFQIKGELLENDTAVLLFESYLGSEVVGFGGLFIGPGDIMINEYSGYSFPISYENELIPDSAIIYVVSAATGLFVDPGTQEPIDIGTVTEGSFIVVDHITFSFTNPVHFIVEDTTENPIQGALVQVFEEGTLNLLDEALTDEEGISSFDFAPGTYDFMVSKEGYYLEEIELSFVSEEEMDPILVILHKYPGPHVLERTPEVNQIMVEVDTEVSATFTVDIAEVDFEGITILDENMQELPELIISIDGATLYIEHQGLDYNSVYTVEIPMGSIEDADTNEELAFNISWSFMTINPIDMIYDVDDIEVIFNTNEAVAIAALATQTVIADIVGGLHMVDLTWVIEDYDQITPGDYNAIGSFDLPQGVHQTDPETILEVHATVTVLDAPVIVGIDIYDVVQDIIVPYGTPEAVAIGALEAEIKISDSDGGEHTVILDWTITDYDGEVPGDYNATGTFTLPFGVDQTDPETSLEVHAIVTVLDPPEIVDIDIYNVVQDITVPYGTAEADAINALETDIKISDSYNDEHSVVVTWTIEDYDGEEPGDYSATGTFDLPEGVFQSDPETVLEVYATVTVLEKPTIAEIDVLDEVVDIEVEYETSEADAINELTPQIRIKDSYETLYTVNLVWTIEDYNGEEPGNYQATGTFALPTGVYQTDPETELKVTAYVTVLEPSSIAGFNKKQISIYPNPSSGIINITNIQRNAKIEIVNIIGQVVKTVQSTDDKISVDLSELAEGIYFVNINNSIFKINILR